MNSKDFVELAAGRIIQTPTGFSAFVPAPLPPRIDYDSALVRLLSEADAAVSELSGLGKVLPNPHLLIIPYVRREAVLSSRIEGTRATLSDLLLDELGAAPPGPERRDDVREVRNYVRALEFGVARLADLPVSLRLVREVHERLLEDVRGQHATRGEFRKSQNWIGPAGSTPTTAAYVPPPVNEMTTCLDAWERFLHERDSLPDLIHAALAHAQFESIHPFLDGNGRVGRLLVTLLLVERGRLSQPLLYLSQFIEANKQDYYDLLQRTRTHGDWIAWIRYFLTGARDMANAACVQSRALLDLRAKLSEQFRGKPRHIQLLEKLFENPYITAASAASALSVTNPTARSVLRALEDGGVLKEFTGRDWGRIYVAEPIMRAIDVTDAS